MRLAAEEKDAIRQETARLAPGGDAYIFGSRTDPAGCGGDIDLLLLTDEKLPLRTLRVLRRAILQKIGEQKLDIVNFARLASHPFKEIALSTAVKL